MKKMVSRLLCALIIAGSGVNSSSWAMDPKPLGNKIHINAYKSLNIECPNLQDRENRRIVRIDQLKGLLNELRNEILKTYFAKIEHANSTLYSVKGKLLSYPTAPDVDERYLFYPGGKSIIKGDALITLKQYVETLAENCKNPSKGANDYDWAGLVYQLLDSKGFSVALGKMWEDESSDDYDILDRGKYERPYTACILPVEYQLENEENRINYWIIDPTGMLTYLRYGRDGTSKYAVNPKSLGDEECNAPNWKKNWKNTIESVNQGKEPRKLRNYPKQLDGMPLDLEDYDDEICVSCSGIARRVAKYKGQIKERNYDKGLVAMYKNDTIQLISKNCWDKQDKYKGMVCKPAPGPLTMLPMTFSDYQKELSAILNKGYSK